MRNAAAGLLMVAMALGAHATERGAIRALNGAAGAEVSSAQFPGWYGQFWLQRYHATKLRDDGGNTPTQVVNTPVGPVPVTREGEIDATVGVARVTWLSELRLGDGRFGFSGTLPLVHLKQIVHATGNFAPAVPAPVRAAIQAQFDAAAAAASGSRSGAGDMELMPYVDWQTDSERFALGLGLVAPTGRYDAASAVNPGAGKFWTLRPLAVASHVWENGWEAGVRAAYSINAKNSDTQNRSGQYLAADFSTHYRLNDFWKLGLQGYLNWQTTADRCADPVASLCGKVRVLGLGPSLNYVSEDGRLYLDAKIVREFGVRNRPEGTTLWLRANIRLDD